MNRQSVSISQPAPVKAMDSQPIIPLKSGLTLEEMSHKGQELLGLQSTEEIDLDGNAHNLIMRLRSEGSSEDSLHEKLAELARTEKQALRDLWQCASTWYASEFNYVLLETKFEEAINNACSIGMAKFMSKLGDEDRKLTCEQIEEMTRKGIVRPDPSILLEQPELHDVLADLWQNTGILMADFIGYHETFVHDLVGRALIHNPHSLHHA